MATPEFYLPAELDGATYESILNKMLSLIPDRFDKTEGSFAYDFIAPSALEAAELIQFWLALGLRNNFYFWSSGSVLDLHARNIGLARRAGTAASGDLTVVTTKPVTFPEGFIFCVPAEDFESATLDFETVEETTLDGEGTVHVRCVQSGLIGNVAAHTIILMKTPLKNVSSITNAEPFTGGTLPESDDDLRQRIEDFYAGRGNSFVGNKRDYMRWATSVPGVGAVKVIPCYDGPNSVKIILTDTNGEAANEDLCAAVEKYIFGEDHNDLERLAPIGLVKWEVAPPRLRQINISLKAELSLEAEVVVENIKSALENFFATLGEGLDYSSLRFVDVSKVLADVAGLDDFKRLRIDGTMNNVEFEDDEMPAVGEITLQNFI